MKKRRDTTARTGVELVEEAGNLLRAAPAAAWLAYYVGSVPFMLLLLQTITYAQSGITTGTTPAADALLLALAFVWMKCWQAVFAGRVAAHLRRAEPARWNVRRVLRLISQQTLLQPLGLLVIPASLLVMVPFAWAHAWYQNVTVLGQGEGGVMETASRASQQSKLWPKQNHLGIWLVSPWLVGFGIAFFFLFMVVMVKVLPTVLWLTFLFIGIGSFFLFVGLSSPLGFIVAANIAGALVFIPWAAHTWFGWRTGFTLAGLHGIFNTTFLLTVFCLTYLLLDPLMKTFYILRCFYGLSRATGEDLRIEIRPRKSPALAVLLLTALFAFAAPDRAAAQPAPAPAGVDATRLDRSIDEVLQQPEFRWRLPRDEVVVKDTEKSAIAKFFQSITETIERAAKWVLEKLEWLERKLRKLMYRDSTSESSTARGGTGLSTLGTFLVYLLIALVLIAIIYLIRRWRTARAAAPPVTAVAAQPLPDIHDESVLANRLPSDEWLAMARDFMAKGEWRPALRALFLANLALLAHRELIAIARGKSNHDYLRELRRRAHALPDVPPLFGANLNIFERVWYGRDEAGQQLADEFQRRIETLRDLVPAHETEAARV